MSLNQDTFEFKFNLNKKPDLPLTVRKMLSFVASFFDPLGLMTLLLLRAKILLQDLCNSGSDRDEVSEEYLDRWSQWVNSLEYLKGLSITRCYKNPAHVDFKDIQLHHFTDASDKRYGVASHLRFADMNWKVHCALIMGKSRVKPKKPITTPRAELVAEVVAVKQHLQILEELECTSVLEQQSHKIPSVHCYSCSVHSRPHSCQAVVRTTALTTLHEAFQLQSSGKWTIGSRPPSQH